MGWKTSVFLVFVFSFEICGFFHGFEEAAAAAAWLLPLQPRSEPTCARRAKPTSNRQEIPPRPSSIQMAEAQTEVIGEWNQLAARGQSRSFNRDYFGSAASIFSLESKAPLPFLESLLPSRPLPARLGLCCGRVGGHVQNPLPVVKETCYFDRQR